MLSDILLLETNTYVAVAQFILQNQKKNSCLRAVVRSRKVLLDILDVICIVS